MKGCVHIFSLQGNAEIPCSFSTSCWKKQPHFSTLWPLLVLATLSSVCKGLRALGPHCGLPTPELSPFARGFPADVSHLEQSRVQALLAVHFRLEVCTGCGRDSKDGLLITLTTPSGFLPHKKRHSRRRQIEPGSYSPPHMSRPLFPFSVAMAGWAWFGEAVGKEKGSPCMATLVTVAWGLQSISSACPGKNYTTQLLVFSNMQDWRTHCCSQANRIKVSTRLPKTLSSHQGTDLCPPPSQICVPPGSV